MSAVKGKLHWLQAAIIFVLAVLQYSSTSEHDYAWDDAIVITQNTRVQKGLSDIPELFENIKSDRTENRYGYRPIALLSFATDVELFGMNPKASHKVNILFYGILCVLVYFFLMGFLGSEIWSWAIFAMTALFVVHPLHTEVVANIKSRDEILALAFGLAALIPFRKALVSGKLLFYLATAIMLVLAFNSKESAITFCGVLIAVPFYVQQTANSVNWRKWFMGLGVSVLLFMALLGIRQYVYSDQFFQTNDFELMDKGIFLQDGYVGNPLWDADMKTRIANAFFLIANAVYRFFMPYPLVHDYSLSMFEVRTWGDWQVYLSIVVTVILILVMVFGLWKKRAIGLGLVLFFSSISIYLHLVHVGPDIFAERYLFVPSLGICVALISLFEFFPNQRKLFAVIIVVVSVPFFGSSWNRNKAWKDNQTLLETDIPNLHNCARANYNYALYLHDKYYTLPKPKKPQARAEILKYYERAYQITDRIFKVYMDLGAAYMEFGYPQKGYDVFIEASLKYPILSGPYVQLGKFHMSFSQYEQAIPYFDKAIFYGKENSDYYYYKGLCQVQTGNLSDAISTLETGESFGISVPDYYALMVNLYVKSGDRDKAISTFETGLERFPSDSRLLELKKKLSDQLD